MFVTVSNIKPIVVTCLEISKLYINLLTEELVKTSLAARKLIIAI
jgi:hypothetical protein